MLRTIGGSARLLLQSISGVHLARLPVARAQIVAAAALLAPRQLTPDSNWGLEQLWGTLTMIRMGVTERMRILDSNYGRLAGWIIECDGMDVGRLYGYSYLDMFWDRYLISDDGHAFIFGEEWWRTANVSFRNAVLDYTVGDCMVGRAPTLENPFIYIRGLYIRAAPPSFSERLMLRLFRMRQMSRLWRRQT
jgi:hypothetical protein